MTGHEYQTAVLEIANKVDNLIQHKAVGAHFTECIDQLCKMVEDYGQAQQPYSQQLEDAKKQIDEFTPEQLEKYKLPDGKIRISLVDVCPPPEGYVKMNYWDNYFVNVPLGTIYRPKEPVNPLLWFGISGNASLQRKPKDNEKLMCDYVRLAIIHDYELRYSGTPTDSYIFTDNYRGRWFQRDEFCEDVWAYYHYVNQSPDLIHMPATAQEKLSQLNRALKHVQANLSPKLVKAKTVYTYEEAKIEKILEHGRPVIPDKPFISQPVKIVLDNNPPPEGYREALTQKEIAIINKAVPEPSYAGLEAFLRREYNMGDERIKDLTWEQIIAFCTDYINSQKSTKSEETEQETQKSGDTYNITGEHISFGDKAQHAGRDIITSEPEKEKWYQTKTFKGAVIALVVALLGGGIPAWLSLRDKTDNEIVKKLEEQAQKTKAHLTHQLIVQPVVGSKDDLGYQLWSVILIITNTGPATAKLSRTSLQYPVNREIKLYGPPRLTSKPVTGQVEISGTSSRGWYDIALSNLSINDGFVVQADLLVSENIREKTTKEWKMNDADFVRQFIFLVSTSGENVEPEYSGAYPIPTLSAP